MKLLNNNTSTIANNQVKSNLSVDLLDMVRHVMAEEKVVELANYYTWDCW